MINHDCPIPLHKQIQEIIRDRVHAGQWPKHYKLKPETELAQEFGVSRGTVRQALQILEEEGLLTQVQGRGTFVTAKSKDLPLAQQLVTMHEILAATGQTFTTEVLSHDVMYGPDDIRALLDLPRDENLLRLRRRLMVEGEPFVVLDNFVRIGLCPRMKEIDFSEVPLFEALEDFCGLNIGWGQRSFEATTAEMMAETLMTDKSEPVLYLEQITYLADGTPLEYSDVWVRGQKLRLTTILSRQVKPTH